MKRGRSKRIMELLEKENCKENSQANFQNNQMAEFTKFEPAKNSATKYYLQPDKVFGYPVTYEHYAAITKKFNEFATSQNIVEELDLDIFKTSALSFFEVTTHNTYYENSDDSVKDKDYFPSDQELSSDSDSDSCSTSTAQFINIEPASVHKQEAPAVIIADHRTPTEQQGADSDSDACSTSTSQFINIKPASVHKQEAPAVIIADHTTPTEQQGADSDSDSCSTSIAQFINIEPASVHKQEAPAVIIADHTTPTEQQGADSDSDACSTSTSQFINIKPASVHKQGAPAVTIADHTTPTEQQGDSERTSVYTQEEPLQSAVTVAGQTIPTEQQLYNEPAFAPLQEMLLAPCSSATTITQSQDIPYTKKGTIRQRKKYEESVEERQDKKLKKIKDKHSVITTNRNCCKKNCSEKFSKTDQDVKNNEFWRLSWREQKLFIGQRLSTKDPARRSKPNEDRNKRQVTIEYSFEKNGKDEIVCKEFFLNTLGFKKDNSSAIKSALKFKECYDKEDGRGRNPKPKFDRKLITDHINSYNPTISHYRREHAPNRRYLAPELTIQSMYNDFSENHEKKCSYDLYRETVKSMNISFAKLGSEECDKCEQYKFHNPEYTLLRHFNCEICKTHDIHLKKSEIARKIYKESSSGLNKATYTADLQKVIMLPRIDSMKAVVFCPRLIAFNESFVPVGKSEDAPIAVLWHEAISGRKKEDIVSTFRRFFLEMRDKQHITLWLDNCSGQNKNWTLFSYIVHVINSNEMDAQTIVLNYFEPGHTHMSADHFHHQVELAMKKDPKIYDFDDLKKVVQKANNGKVLVIPMCVEDFFEFEDYAAQKKLSSQRPRPYLNDMVQIKFCRGKRTFSYKNMFDEEETELDFIKKCHLKGQLPPPIGKTEPRGIDSTRKMNILQRLSKLMPANRVKFWQDLPTKDGVPNLTVDRDD